MHVKISNIISCKQTSVFISVLVHLCSPTVGTCRHNSYSNSSSIHSVKTQPINTESTRRPLTREVSTKCPRNSVLSAVDRKETYFGDAHFGGDVITIKFVAHALQLTPRAFRISTIRPVINLFLDVSTCNMQLQECLYLQLHNPSFFSSLTAVKRSESHFQQW